VAWPVAVSSHSVIIMAMVIDASWLRVFCCPPLYCAVALSCTVCVVLQIPHTSVRPALMAEPGGCSSTCSSPEPYKRGAASKMNSHTDVLCQCVSMLLAWTETPADPHYVFPHSHLQHHTLSLGSRNSGVLISTRFVVLCTLHCRVQVREATAVQAHPSNPASSAAAVWNWPSSSSLPTKASHVGARLTG
jgi:hypothetical protein